MGSIPANTLSTVASLHCPSVLKKEPEYDWKRTRNIAPMLLLLCHLFLADPVMEQTTLFDSGLHLPWFVQKGGGSVPGSLSHWSAFGEGRSLSHWWLREEAEDRDIEALMNPGRK